MIRAIVAMDSARGIADDSSIPWELPADRAYVKQKTTGDDILMGYNTYKEFTAPLPGRGNLVYVRGAESLSPGFLPVQNPEDLPNKYKNKNLWLFGGAGLYSATIDFTEELYITQVDGDFKCTKFFPEFKNSFRLVEQSEAHQENGITFHFEVWQRKR